MYYALTENMKALYLSKQRQTVNINVELKDGSDVDDFVITEADISSGSFSIDRYCATGENLEIGSAVASEIKFDLDNSTGKFDDVSLGGAKLFVRLGIKDYSNPESTIEFMDCGYFTVDENPKPLTVISVAALDNMMKFDREVNWDNFVFPMTVEAALNVCCTDCAVTLSPSVSFTGLPNGSYSIPQPPATKDITYRTLVQWIAEITGTCAYADWNGHLRLSWCESTDIEITPSVRYSSIVEDAITVTGVQITESEEEKYLYGEEGFVFNIEGNDLIQHDRIVVAENLGDVLCGFTYVPFECSCFPMPYLYPLDMISFTDVKGNKFNTIVTAHVYSLNGTSSLKASGENQQQSEYAASSPFTKREAVIINRLQNEQKQLKKTEQTTLDLNRSLAYALGLFSSIVEHEDGSVTQYLHSKENIENCVEGDFIFCLNAGGFGLCTTGWNNGQPVFDNGFDAKSGAALWRYLSAHKISADLIEAGRITSANGSTYFDLDNNEFALNVKNEAEEVFFSAFFNSLGFNSIAPCAIGYVEFFENGLTQEQKDYIESEISKIDNPVLKSAMKASMLLGYWALSQQTGFFVESTNDGEKYVLHYSGNKLVFTKYPEGVEPFSEEMKTVAHETSYGPEGITSTKDLFLKLYDKDSKKWHILDFLSDGTVKIDGGYLNPPMKVNTEYLTAERYEGKSVYVKLIDFGNLPNASEKSVPTGIDGRKAFDMKFDIHMSNGQLTCFPYVSTAFESITRAYLEAGGDLVILTKTDLSAYTAKVTVKYTKS